VLHRVAGRFRRAIRRGIGGKRFCPDILVMYA
jgi:hypothetical protein